MSSFDVPKMRPQKTLKKKPFRKPLQQQMKRNFGPEKTNPGCYLCADPDHLAANCPLGSRVCFRCQKPGHDAKDCTENPRRPLMHKENPMSEQQKPLLNAPPMQWQMKKSFTNDQYQPDQDAAAKPLLNARASARCFLCAKNDHFASDCPMGARVCFVCQEPGHEARNCPQRVPPAEQYRSLLQPPAQQQQEQQLKQQQQPQQQRQQPQQQRQRQKADQVRAEEAPELEAPTKDLAPPATVDTSKGILPTPQCFLCGKDDHIASRCPYAADDVCYECQEPGHEEQDCPMRVQKQKSPEQQDQADLVKEEDSAQASPQDSPHKSPNATQDPTSRAAFPGRYLPPHDPSIAFQEMWDDDSLGPMNFQQNDGLPFQSWSKNWDDLGRTERSTVSGLSDLNAGANKRKYTALEDPASIKTDDLLSGNKPGMRKYTPPEDPSSVKIDDVQPGNKPGIRKYTHEDSSSARRDDVVSSNRPGMTNFGWSNPLITPNGLTADESSTLFVDGLPTDCSRREISHLFRPFMGFKDVRVIHKERRKANEKASLLCFVEFNDSKCALTALEALQGYKFDDKKQDSSVLKIQFARASLHTASIQNDRRQGSVR